METKIILSIVLRGINVNKPASQSINISRDAYESMTSALERPYWVKKPEWLAASKEKRLELHMKRISDHLGGISYSYEVFND